MDNNIFKSYMFWVFSIFLFLLFSLMFISAFFLPVDSVSNQMNPVFYAKTWLETGNNLDKFMSWGIPIIVITIVLGTIVKNIKNNKVIINE